MFKHSRSLYSFFLAIVLFLGLLPGKAWAVSQEEIDRVRAQRDAIRVQRLDKQALVDALNLQQADVLRRKAAMDERNAFTLEQIELTGEEIRLNDLLLAEKAQELEDARSLELEQLQRYRVRVRAMEENGRLGLLSILLRSADLSEFLTSLDDIGEIMKSDRELEDAYIDARRRAESVRAEYEAVKTELSLRQTQLQTEQEQLQGEIEEANELIRSLQEDISGRQAEYEAILAAEWEADAQLERLMAELERQRQEELERRRREEERLRQEEEARRQAEEESQRRAEEEAQHRAEEEARRETGGVVVGTGSFLWPVPGHTYVTSRFGMRVHPITGVKKSHTGIDISAETGTTIVAADSGTVTKAAVYSGYGNCVILDHGNGYVTLYGHMSRIAVSEGENVSQGQSIGSVGSTGVSTGPHCHFEIWSGGSRVDPEQFFTGLEFSPGAGE